MFKRISRPDGSNRRGYRRQLFFAVVCVAPLFGAASCGLWREEPENLGPIIRAAAWTTVANGRATPLSAAQEAPLMNRVAANTFGGQVTAAYPPSASGEAQKIALGRAAARRAILREFSTQVREFGSVDDPIFVQFFGREEGWDVDFEAFLEIELPITYENKPRGVVATVAMPGEDLFAWFIKRHAAAGDAESGAAQAPASDLPARRLTAKNKATTLAREALIAQLADIAEGSRPFSLFRRRNKALEALLRSRVQSQEPDQIVFANDARCVAVMTFSRAELELLQSQGGRSPESSDSGVF